MGSPLLRLYRSQPYGSTACGFRDTGPFSRFDHHWAGQRRGIHYSAPSLSACVVEVFGDTGLIEAQDFQLALLGTHCGRQNAHHGVNARAAQLHSVVDGVAQARLKFSLSPRHACRATIP
jgi:hypothetical protein